MQITSDEAEAVIRAAKGKAANTGIAVSIVILDMAGHLKAFLRMMIHGLARSTSR